MWSQERLTAFVLGHFVSGGTYAMSEDLTPRVNSSVGKGYHMSKFEPQRCLLSFSLTLKPWGKEAPGNSPLWMEMRFSEGFIPGWFPPQQALEFWVPTKPQTDGCKCESGLVEVEPYPKGNLPLGCWKPPFLCFLFFLLLNPVQKSRISMKRFWFQYNGNELSQLPSHRIGKSFMQIFPCFRMKKTKLYLKDSIFIGIHCIS